MSSIHVSELDLNLIRVLRVMLEERNVTRAAARLGTTQSAVSDALRRLRSLFDDPLFVRTPQAMVPTARAEQMREPLEEAFERLEVALAGAAFEPKTSRRLFRIGAADYHNFVFVPPLMKRLQKRAPHVNLLCRTPVDRHFTSLHEGEVDVTFSLNREATGALRTRRLLRERFVSIVRKGHPLVKRKLTLERYVELPHVLVAPSGARRGFVDEALAKHGLERRVAVVVPHFLVAPTIVAETDMVLTIAERVARRLVHGLPIRVVEAPVEIDGYSVHLFWHERDQRDPAHTWLRNEIAAVAK